MCHANGLTLPALTVDDENFQKLNIDKALLVEAFENLPFERSELFDARINHEAQTIDISDLSGRIFHLDLSEVRTAQPNADR